jgi:enoyl-CoA hydratase/carnithine racemase
MNEREMLRGMAELVHVEQRDDGVAVITLDNPKVNALSGALLRQLHEIVDTLATDLPGAVVVTGGERIFAAGADISEFGGQEEARVIAATIHGALDALAALPRFVIAAVAGYALGGGCELAMACDYRVASERAVFGQPEILLGIIPGGGGTQRLARVMGKQRAMELVLTGRRIDATEAHRLGLVNQVAPRDGWLAAALELAAVIASRPPLAVRLGKQAVLAADETPLSAGLESERRLFELAMATEDRVEGMKAFVEKRPPEFRGR